VARIHKSENCRAVSFVKISNLLFAVCHQKTSQILQVVKLKIVNIKKGATMRLRATIYEGIVNGFLVLVAMSAMIAIVFFEVKTHGAITYTGIFLVIGTIGITAAMVDIFQRHFEKHAALQSSEESLGTDYNAQQRLRCYRTLLNNKDK
jgi:hypothetical protein